MVVVVVDARMGREEWMGRMPRGTERLAVTGGQAGREKERERREGRGSDGIH